jgi:hypothetical protein
MATCAGSVARGEGRITQYGEECDDDFGAPRGFLEET